MQTAKPYVIAVDKPEFKEYSEGRWYSDYEVTLGDQNIADEYKTANVLKKIHVRLKDEKFINPDGRFGEQHFFLVCSPAYKANPDRTVHDEEDVKRAYVQDKHNEQEALDYLNTKISQIGEVDFKTLEAKLNEFLLIVD